MNLQNAKRIMIIGDVASGKSTFSIALGKKLSLPVIHMDVLQQGKNRSKDISEIQARIISEANKDTWIMDGNAFRKDLDFRINRADLIILFESTPVQAISRHILRHLKSKITKAPKAGGTNENLELLWFAKYTLRDWPKRKKTVEDIIRSMDKDLIVIKNHKQAEDLLRSS